MYFVSEQTIDDLLDLLELTFRCIADLANLTEYQRQDRGISISPENAISELNFRLREAGFGYQFEGHIIIRLDSQYIHAEAVKPALSLLADKRFHGPQQEFLHVHEHYRKARADDHKMLEDVIVSALKSFESTIKVICDVKQWQYDPKDTASRLIQVITDHELIPPYLQTSLVGLATLRNKAAGHGEGSERRDVPYYLAGYALHLAASNIVMLVESFKATTPSV
jgi:AbiJ N-terminal domain 4